MVAIPTPLSTTRAFDGVHFEDTVDRAAHGDSPALEDVLATIRPLITQYCRARRGGPASDTAPNAPADELARQVCADVVEALPTYRAHRQHFLAFVYRIAAHKVNNTEAPAATQPRAQHSAYPTTSGNTRASARRPTTRQPEPPTNRDIAELVRGLPDTQREILVLRVVGGLTAEQTANAVGLTAAAVRVVQHRALARLRGAIITGGPGTKGPL